MLHLPVSEGKGQADKVETPSPKKAFSEEELNDEILQEVERR
jgi:hypothetical protein